MHKEEFNLLFTLHNRLNRQLGIIKAQNDVILKQLAITNNISLDKLLNEVNELDAKYLHQYLEDKDYLFEQAFGNPESDS